MRATPLYEDHSALPQPPGGLENPTTALYKAALGPVNTPYYLALFERFDAAGRAGLVWNGAAGFFTLNWMAFRGLWGVALVYLAAAEGLALMVLGLGRQYLNWPMGVELGVLGSLLLLSIALPGLYGNALLHAEIRRRMATAVTNAHTVREACESLEQQAPSRKRLQAFMVGNSVLLVVALGLASYLLFRPQPEVAVVPVTPAPPLAVPVATPEPPEPPVPPVLAPLPETVVEDSAQSVIVEPTPAPVTDPAPPPPVVRAETPPATTPPAPPPPAPAEQKPPAPVAADPHGINVGLFAEEANAVKVHAQLTQAGLPATMQTVEGSRGPRTRVRAGPFPDRDSAEAAARRIRGMGLEAQIFRQ